MSTAQYLIDKWDASSHITVSGRKNGTINVIEFDDGKSIYPTVVTVMGDAVARAMGNFQFVISLPIGNKIPDTFFPEDEREKLRNYFRMYG